MSERQFLRVAGFDELQSPKRPKRPSWIKSRVDDLDNIEYMKLSLSARGFLADFTKLAATLQNRVPCDFSFIAQRLCSRPTTVAQHVRNTVAAGFLLESNPSRNPKETTTCEENGNPSGNLLSSSSNSSLQGSTTELTTTTVPELAREFLVDPDLQELVSLAEAREDEKMYLANAAAEPAAPEVLTVSTSCLKCDGEGCHWCRAGLRVVS